ncbi:MAG: class II aldolase/adducin family protein [Phycisphaerae bacterium]|nr:class II aldolase/adducin family protein [Phycisphaerae bacterium]
MKQTQDTAKLLEQITALSHQYGTPDYVRGGGGNTSVKTAKTLWVKPSGTTLKDLRPDLFVALDRAKLSRLYDIVPPAESAARETVVKDVMGDAVLPSSKGRASVEAPLHDSLAATFVVHTHPALVNGITCAKEGKAACQKCSPMPFGWITSIPATRSVCRSGTKSKHLRNPPAASRP